MTPLRLAQLKKDSRVLKPIVNIGKNGLEQNHIIEIQKHLKKRKLIKVRFLKSVSDQKKDFVAQLAQKTQSEVINTLGSVCVLYKQ